jgi:urease accessory protein
MRRPGLIAFWLTLAVTLTATPSVHAHLINTGFGPFYDGLTHLFVTPQDLLRVFALALLAGPPWSALRPRRPLRPAGCMANRQRRARRPTGSGLSASAAGVAAALFVVVSLLAGQAASVRVPWARVAVRVAGSWIVAIGLLMLGWAMRVPG